MQQQWPADRGVLEVNQLYGNTGSETPTFMLMESSDLS